MKFPDLYLKKEEAALPGRDERYVCNRSAQIGTTFRIMLTRKR
jgi:hypothetical protein